MATKPMPAKPTNPTKVEMSTNTEVTLRVFTRKTDHGPMIALQIQPGIALGFTPSQATWLANELRIATTANGYDSLTSGKATKAKSAKKSKPSKQ